MIRLINCIGSGNMGSALMKAAATVAGGARIGVGDTDRPKAIALATEIGGYALKDNAEAVSTARFVLLAVKPQVLPELLSELRPVLLDLVARGELPVLVSIVAGASIAAMRAVLAGLDAVPIIRLMPNTPALVAKGMIALSAGPEVGEGDIRELEQLLSAAGIVDRVEEKYMNAVTALSGSGPAYAYMFIEALADGGVLAGLPRDKALRYAARTVLGSAAMVEETGMHPGALKDAVCSPAGTTIAGVSALEARAFRGTVIAAVEAGFRRAVDLGKPTGS